MRLEIRTIGTEHDKEVIQRLAEKNIEGKLDSYFKKFDQDEVSLALTIKSVSGRFDGKLDALAGKKAYRYARERYKKMDDLINHLFLHLKTDLSEVFFDRSGKKSVGETFLDEVESQAGSRSNATYSFHD